MIPTATARFSVDGKLVVDNESGVRDTHNAIGAVTLAAGAHTVEVRYTWINGTGIMEVFWTPPNGLRTMFGPEGFQAARAPPSAQAQSARPLMSGRRRPRRRPWSRRRHLLGQPA